LLVVESAHYYQLSYNYNELKGHYQYASENLLDELVMNLHNWSIKIIEVSRQIMTGFF
jgi:hypothetical protein